MQSIALHKEIALSLYGILMSVIIIAVCMGYIVNLLYIDHKNNDLL